MTLIREATVEGKRGKPAWSGLKRGGVGTLADVAQWTEHLQPVN